MPHHSGGHHSSHHSHHSSHHSSHHRRYRNGSGGSSLPQRKFIYYDRRGREKAVYCSQMPKPQSPFLLVIYCFVFLGYFIKLLLPVITFLPAPFPSKINSTCTSVSGHVEDTIGRLSDKEGQLEKALEQFEDKTGICPYILTVHDSDWSSSTDLITYSYDSYVNRFPDEYHFVIVYSENSDGTSCQWEATQGYDTDGILTDKNFSKFQSDLNNKLSDSSISTEESFTEAFSGSLDYLMKSGISSSFLTALIPIGFSSLIMILLFCPLLLSWFRSRYTYYEDTSYIQGGSGAISANQGNQYGYGTLNNQYGPYDTRNNSQYGTQNNQYNQYGTQNNGQFGPYDTRNSSQYGTQYNQYSPYGNQNNTRYGTAYNQYTPHGSQNNGQMDEISLSQVYPENHPGTDSSDSYQGPEIK